MFRVEPVSDPQSGEPASGPLQEGDGVDSAWPPPAPRLRVEHLQRR